MKPLINTSRVRQFILDQVAATRQWECTRVSPAALQAIEEHVKKYVCGLVQAHPSIGKTFTEAL